MATSLSARMNNVQAAIRDATVRLPEAMAVEVYDDHAIVRMDGSHYRVSYSVRTKDDGSDPLNTGPIVLASFDSWQKVSPEWTPTKTTAVSIKAITDDTVTVAGYGVVFGGVDLEGETFSADTDYMLGLVPEKPVYYDHSAAIKHSVGKATTVAPDEFGIWVEAELDRHAEYVAQIETLVESGALGWSSGAVGHLSQRDGKAIKRWPVVEFSLTPTPAEPRTLGVDVIKSMAEADESFAALLPEEPGNGSDQDVADTEAEALRLTIEIMEMEV